jgi:sec-independent protein translocase protein TatC
MATQPKTLPGPAPDPEARMTFTQHLGELRARLLRSCGVVGVAFFGAWFLSNSLIKLLQWPLLGLDITWTTLNPLEAFIVKLKVSLYGSIVVTLPYLLFELCAFIFPGLTAKERQAAKIMIAGCAVLGMAGASLAYWGVFPIVLPYVSQLTPDTVETQLRLNETIGLIFKGLLGFTMAFQFPMVVLVLVFLGILTPSALKAHRKIAILLIFVVAALLTPPDPISMMLLAVPLTVLYELSILGANVIVARKANALRKAASQDGEKG